MLNEQVVKGNWTELRGRVKDRWGSLTDDDLVRAEGQVDTLVGIIQQRTGESREHIEHELDQMTDDYGSKADKVRRKASQMTDDASKTAREYSEQAKEAARGQYDRAHEQYDAMAGQVRAKYHDAENAVRRNPAESLGVAFGAGLMMGLVVGLSCYAARR